MHLSAPACRISDADRYGHAQAGHDTKTEVCDGMNMIYRIKVVSHPAIECTAHVCFGKSFCRYICDCFIVPVIMVFSRDFECDI